MPSVKIALESLSLLVKKAEKLGITVKDLVDTIIMDHFDEIDEGDDEGDDEGEEIEESEEDQDLEG